MADDSTPNANPYIDPENLAFEQAFGAILGGKQLTDVSIADARKALDKVQTHRANPDISTAHFLVPTCHGPVKTFLYTPKGASANLPLIVHLHGGGFIIGDVFSYEPFVFDLVLRTKMAVALPEYTLAPQRKFPVQHEQCLEVVQYLVKHGSRKGLDTGKIAITSDSAGVSILNHQRALKLPIAHQVLLHPFLNFTSEISTFSDFEFQNGPLLSSALID